MARSLAPIGCGLLALAAAACSSSQPPTLPSLAAPSPPAADAQSSTPQKPGTPPVSLGSNAAQPAKEPATAGGLGQITAIRTATVVLYTSDDGMDGQRVPASTLGLPMPVAGRSPKRLAIHTVEGVRWIAIADVTYAAPQTTAKAKP